MRNKSRFYSILLLFLSSCMLLSACGSQSAEKMAAIVTSETTPIEAAAEEISYDTAADAGEGLTQASPSAGYIPTDRKLIREVHMSVETTDFDNLITQINTKLSQLEGYTESASLTGASITTGNSSRPKSAHLTLRIPSDKLELFITDVEANGNITNKSETTTDVSLQYADAQSHKKSLEIEQERIWALLEKADTMEAILSLESHLSEIRYELESYESQLRQYDNKVDYSTITLDITEVRIFTPMEEASVGQRIRNGFAENIYRISNGLLELFIWLLAGSPYWAPLIILAAVVFFILRKKIKLKKTKQKTETTESPEDNGPNE